MLGLVVVLMLSFSLAWVGSRAIGEWWNLDPAEAFGLGGLLAIGATGWLTFVLFWLGMGVFAAPIAYVAVLGIAWLIGRGAAPTSAGIQLLPSALFLPFALIACINALAPPDTLEWDSLAYHLAVPKIWAAAGSPVYLPTQHHSNFPFALDILYMPLLSIGESAAKGLSVGLLALGLIAVFGLTRRWFSASSAWLSTFALAAVPVVLWETGTAYIDVGHGLYAGLAILYVSEFRTRANWPLVALLLGLACSTKFTGLQTTVVLMVVGGCWLLAKKRQLVPKLALAGVAAIAIASPWMIRNVTNTGNPVYPFLYEKFGGRGWDQWRADIYRNEQQTFGVGRTEDGRDWTKLPHAALGLAYQPGRYINPQQTEGGGFPMGAVGALIPILAIAALTMGKRDERIGLSMAAVGVSLIMWFALSQQSRYMVSLAAPIVVVGFSWVTSQRARQAAAVLIAVQGAYTAWLLWVANVQRQLPVVLDKITREKFYETNGRFANVAPRVSREVGQGTVALYDEVFGYFLDCDYLWANPGHSTLLDDIGMTSFEPFLRKLKRQADLVLINASYFSESDKELWQSQGTIPEAAVSKYLASRDRRWVLFLAEANRAGQLQPVFQDGPYLLLRVR